MSPTQPTTVRRRIVAISFAVAFILYLDRVCLAEIVKSGSFHREAGLSATQTGRVLSVFFLAYALFQVPAGWVSDRFGARGALTGYIVLWSLATALTGAVSSFPALLGMRLLCGVGEAGAYPTCIAVIRRWTPVEGRGLSSALVLLGGRLGGTLAPFLTAWLVVRLAQWRPVLWLDGGAGLVIAGLYWMIVRNRPAEHSACNEAERALIGEFAAEPRLSLRELGGALRTFCLSRSLWLLSLMMFLVNLGWAFLITWLPTYLKEQRGVEDVAGGRLVTLVLACGMVGQVAGGWLTDRSVRQFGLKAGRISVLCASCVLASAAYAGCLLAQTVPGLIACFALVSFAVDLGNPVIWAFLQDIGGRFTAAAAGWANMWGNLGAALASLMIPWLVAMGVTREGGQRHVFMVCAGALLVGGVAALGLDASKPLRREIV